MPRLKHLALFLCSATLLLSGAGAREVSPEQAGRAVGHWLRQDRKPLGARLSLSARGTDTFRDTDGAALFYVVRLDGGGFVVTSADDEIEPIVAFSDSGEFVADARNPLWALLHRDLPRRRDAVRSRQFGLSNSGFGGWLNNSGGGGQRQRGLRFEKNAPSPAAQWAALDAPVSPLAMAGALTLSDVRVPPLVLSQWNQRDVGGRAVFNYYTPPGPDGAAENYHAGCVATAGAQVMRFFQWPQASVAAADYLCKVGETWQTARPQLLRMKGGVYDWNQMPLTVSDAITEPQRQSIGKLLHDVGVASKTAYGANASSAYSSDLADALRQRFGYASAVYAYTSYYVSPNVSVYLADVVLANLDAGAPVIFGIRDSSGAAAGHEVVGDGYGYAGDVLYVHLNMGWGGADNAWYNLPNIDAEQQRYSVVDDVIFNIDPRDTGEIISGRVLNANGEPVGAGVAVSVSGGATRQTVTDSRGIYAVRVPANGSYTVSAPSGGGAASLTVAVGQPSGYYWSAATDWTVTVSNRWGQNLRLSASAQPAVSLSGPAAATAGQGVAFTAGVSGGAAPYTYRWHDGATLLATTTAPAATLTFSAAGKRTVSVTVTDQFGLTATASRTLTVSAANTPPGAVLSETLAWTTGGGGNWFGQSRVPGHGGGGAAQSGSVGDSQASWMQTTVSGAGQIVFWWKISSEAGGDFLRFYIDGVLQDKISGERDWARREFTVSGGGPHTLRWEYEKNGSLSAGADAAWLGDVSWDNNSNSDLRVTPDSCSVPAGASASRTVSVSARDSAWQIAPAGDTDTSWLSVAPASGTVSGSVTFTCAASPDTSGPFASRVARFTVSGPGGTDWILVTQASPLLTLGVALNNSTLPWLSDSDGGWFGETTEWREGGAAAQSGIIGDGQTSAVQTTVSGAGKISFWWRVSSEENYDHLRFFIDGVEQDAISGEVPWAQRQFIVSGGGAHVLKWEYAKDDSLSRGSDAGWLDAAAWSAGETATLAVTPDPDSALHLSVASNISWRVSVSAAWLSVSRAQGNNNDMVIVSCEPHLGAAARVGTVTVSGGGITRTVNITQPGNPGATLSTLAATLNNSLAWQSGGSGDWFVYNGSAARHTPLADSQSAWLQTTVSGPGTIGFSWQVSSEENFDWLRFFIDGVEQAKISGEQNWARREFTVSGAGSHVLKWVYDKDGSDAAGADAGWFGDVTWTPAATPPPVTAALSLSATSKSVTYAAQSFNLGVTGNVAWSAASNAAWLAVSPSAGNGNGTLMLNCAANPNTAARAGTLTVSGGGLTRTVAVTQGGDVWSVAALSGKGVKLAATVAPPKGMKLAKGTKAIYTWKRDGAVIASGTAKTLTVKDSGVYTVTLTYTDSGGRQHSETQLFNTIRVFAQPKTVTVSAAQTTDTLTNSALRATSVVSGETLKLTASVACVGGGAVGPFRYVWYRGSAVLATRQSDLTTDTFTTPAYGDKTVGYKCVVELVAKDLKNKPLAVAKSKDFKAKIILPPSAVTLKLSANPVKEGKPLTLSASAKGTATLLFTWYKNGAQIATGSAKKFTKKPVTVSDAGAYYVVVTQDKTTRRVQSATLTVNIQRADGSIVSGAQSQSAPKTVSTAASTSTPASAAAASTSSTMSTVIPNLAPLTLSAGDVLTVSGSAPREYLILSETHHTTGAYHYEWRDHLTAEFQDAAAETHLTLRFITPDGGVYELTVSGSVGETGTFELRKK